MQQRKRKTDAPSDGNEVTLSVEEGFKLPEFYEKAAAAEISRALKLGAVLLSGDVPPTLNTQVEVDAAVRKVKDECMEQRETQLRAHEASLEKLTVAHESSLEKIAAAHTTELETQRSSLRGEIERLQVKETESQGEIARLIHEWLVASVSLMYLGNLLGMSAWRHAERKAVIEQLAKAVVTPNWKG